MTSITWAIITALIWGIVPLLEKSGLGKVNPLVGLWYRCLGVAVSFVILGFFFVKVKDIRAIDWRSAALLIIGGIMASVIGQLCFYSALKNGEMSRVVPIAASYPFITFFLGVLFFGEAMSVLKIAGIFLIIVGIWALRIG